MHLKAAQITLPNNLSATPSTTKTPVGLARTFIRIIITSSTCIIFIYVPITFLAGCI